MKACYLTNESYQIKLTSNSSVKVVVTDTYTAICVGGIQCEIFNAPIANMSQLLYTLTAYFLTNQLYIGIMDLHNNVVSFAANCNAKMIIYIKYVQL